MAERPRSEAQRAASRANGRRSRGPKTAAGRDKSRRNALRHGLRATSLELLPQTESDPADALLQAVRRELAPRDVTEGECVDGIATAFWRLRRARRLEEAMLGVTDPDPGTESNRGTDPNHGTDPRAGADPNAGADRDSGEADLAKAFSARCDTAGAVALLLRYRSQALGELERWFRLLETRRSREAAATASSASGTAATRRATDAANDNRAAPPATLS